MPSQPTRRASLSLLALAALALGALAYAIGLAWAVLQPPREEIGDAFWHGLMFPLIGVLAGAALWADFLRLAARRTAGAAPAYSRAFAAVAGVLLVAWLIARLAGFTWASIILGPPWWQLPLMALVTAALATAALAALPLAPHAARLAPARAAVLGGLLTLAGVAFTLLIRGIIWLGERWGR